MLSRRRNRKRPASRVTRAWHGRWRVEVAIDRPARRCAVSTVLCRRHRSWRAIPTDAA
ncbi:hypothetical protein SH611_12225 [Geminicoccaceae bacterium 1502E]|nr:hypothetical protein [Geminicoccaceae bacterium 1502E]